MCNFEDMKDEKNTQLVIAHAFKKYGNSGLDYPAIERVLTERGVPVNKVRVRNAMRRLNSNGFITKRGSKYFASFKLRNLARPALCKK